MRISPRSYTKSRFPEYLAEGQKCYVARYRGQIVSAGWWALAGCCDQEVGHELRLAPDEAYSHSGFTVSAFRGKGVHPYLQAQSAQDIAFKHQRVYALVAIEVDNQASLRVWEKLGARRMGRWGCVEFLGFRFHYLWGRHAFRKTKKRFFIDKR